MSMPSLCSLMPSKAVNFCSQVSLLKVLCRFPLKTRTQWSELEWLFSFKCSAAGEWAFLSVIIFLYFGFTGKVSVRASGALDEVCHVLGDASVGCLDPDDFAVGGVDPSCAGDTFSGFTLFFWQGLLPFGAC